MPQRGGGRLKVGRRPQGGAAGGGARARPDGPRMRVPQLARCSRDQLPHTRLRSNPGRRPSQFWRGGTHNMSEHGAKPLGAAVGRVARARRDDRAGSEARSRGMRPSRGPLRCYCWSCSSRKQCFQPKDKRTCVAIATKNKAKFTNNLVLAANGLCLAFVACVSLGSHIRGVPPCARATLKETWAVN